MVLKRKKIDHKPTETADKVEQISDLEASPTEDALHGVSLDELKRDNQPNNSYEDLNHFDFLSDEVILHIFRKLPIKQLAKVALVCKRFNQICEDKSLWTRIDLSNKTLKRGSIGTIMSRQVINLNLEGCRILSPPILPNAKAALPDFDCRLECLDLTWARVEPETLSLILFKCKRLRRLTLEDLIINDRVLNVISFIPGIETLNLSKCRGITVEGFKNLLKYCKKIRELNLTGLTVDSDCIDFICDNLPSTLHGFKFSSCNLLRDQNVNSLVFNCPHLRKLDLSYCDSITGQAVKKLTELEELAHLCLSLSSLISSETLLCLTKMKSLGFLKVFSSSNVFEGDLDMFRHAFEKQNITIDLDDLEYDSEYDYDYMNMYPPWRWV